MVEPSFISSMFKFTFDKPNKEMADLVSLAGSHAQNFHIIEHFGLLIVVRL